MDKKLRKKLEIYSLTTTLLFLYILIKVFTKYPNQYIIPGIIAIIILFHIIAGLTYPILIYPFYSIVLKSFELFWKAIVYFILALLYTCFVTPIIFLIKITNKNKEPIWTQSTDKYNDAQNIEKLNKSYLSLRIMP